ncbi:hypothetical protein M378DRAFT_287582 [Amanita muscaria Koide BX008]|uniref:NACHT domain-containing protein n=1 Tax=Amanita muscaria (strain Koide BX008) TaxID=946122 RepID=A0A0C2SXP8_AMAMK|nr:hypothetical protein M378DRAFT_287582 [Amanita muscaria Koide BX008]
MLQGHERGASPGDGRLGYNSGKSRMYVLSGLAGIGKSTVAYTIASRAADLNLLGASYFFSRDETDRKNAKRFFTTIAYQLYVYNATFAKAIGDMLLTDRGSAATTKDPEEQLQILIVEPLRNILQSRARPILIVVDALDECDDDDGISVLTGLSQLVRNLSSFKVILTTRPQAHLDRFIGSQDRHKIFRLQDIEDKVVNDDIRLYLKHSLSQKQVREQLQDPEEDWCASDAQIESLVRVAGKLFIIAATSVRFILDRFASDPEARMQQLLCAFAQDRTPFKDLSHFYTTILRSAVPANCDDATLVERYQVVVGIIMLVQIPLPIATLALLINVIVKQIRIVVRKLQSVILLGSDDIPRIYHKSFRDYITDSERCQEVDLLIDPRIRQTQITICCLRIMDEHLEYYILGLGDPARFMSNKDGQANDGISDEKLQEMIPLTLQYACTYWTEHLNGANIEDPSLIKELQNFADVHMLHWFEVLSLIEKLDSAHRAIRVVLKLLSDLCQLLSDGLRFISKFYETIKRSALHTYYSALTFTPTDSIFYRRYINGASHNIGHVIGLDKWDALVANLDHGERVEGVQFSLDNTMFTSWSKEGDRFKGVLKVWDAATGIPISTIRGSRFAIASDFSTVASFKGNTIMLYNVNGSKPDATFTTRAEIFGVAISSESSRIAATSSDGTLCLWDSRNGKLIGSFSESAGDFPDRDRNRLQFSTTGARLVYESATRVAKLRNGIDGRFIANLDSRSDEFAFSGDGSQIATLSSSGLKLWSCEGGELVGIAEVAIHYMLAISANGSFLVTGGYGTVKLWSGNSGNLLLLIEVLDLGYGADPFSIVFSPDDTLAIATRLGIQIYNVKSNSFISTLSFASQLGSPLAFSPDRSHLTAGNNDGTVYLWDIRGIESSGPSSNKQASGPVTALALSRDCSRVACGFWDGATELWETDGLAKRQIAAHSHDYPWDRVMTLGFSPDGRRFASGSRNATIKLWDGEDGTLRGAPQYRVGMTPACLYAVEVSNSVLAAATNYGVILWDLQTLHHIHTFERDFETPLSFSFSDNGALLAATLRDTATSQIIVFNVANHTNIAMFQFPFRSIRETTFLPGNSQLVVKLYNNDFFTFDLTLDKEVTQRPTIKHFMNLHNMSPWYDFPIQLDTAGEQLGVLFAEHDDPVPVLWIPRELHAREWAHGRSMIAFGCEDGSVVLLRLPTSHIV